MKIHKTISVFLLLFALLLGLAACGGSSTSSSSSSSADDNLPATDTAIASPPPDIVVVLKDAKIISTVTTFKTGVPYRFIVSNQGKKDHQFVILSSSLNVASMTGNQLQQAALAFVKDVAPGKSAIVDITFPPSAAGNSYQMASYLQTDYQAGLKLPITVAQ